MTSTATLTEMTVIEARRSFGTLDCRRHGAVVEIGGHTLAQFGETYREICEACNGTGYRPGYEFVDSGRCWPCGYTGLRKLVGKGTAAELVKVFARRARQKELRDAKRRAADALAAAAHRTWAAANPDVTNAAIAVRVTDEAFGEGYGKRPYSALLVSLAYKAGHTILTDKQTAALLDMYAEENTRTVQRAAAAAAKREWIGAVGDRVTYTGAIVYTTTSENDYGVSTLYKVTTAEGNTVAWWRSGHHDVALGTVLTIKATVKKLTETQEYGKETQVTRGKIQD